MSQERTEILAPELALNQTVSKVLLYGLVLAILIMLLGIGLWLIRPQLMLPAVVPFAGIPAGLLQGNPTAFLSLGLLVLLATPAMRELVLLISYTRQREWRFAGIALVVMIILAASVVLGLRK
jgi:uncharacterized membrane protein